MNRYKLSINLALIVLGALLVGSALGVFLDRSVFSSQYKQKMESDKLLMTMSLLEQKYVDPIKRDSLIEMLVPLLLSELDPHSSYIPKSEMAATNDPLAGKFDGVGVMFNMLTDTVAITNVISGGPSAKVGIMGGDKIIRINDSLVAGRKLPSDGIVKQLRGAKGTSVRLGIQRGSDSTLITFTVVRDQIPMRSVEAAVMLRDDIGYMKLARFAAPTFREFQSAMQQLKAKGMKKLILDLRSNGGGYLEPAMAIANEFLSRGQKIVYTEGDKSPRREQVADGAGAYQDIKLEVLIDSQTASASEVLSGALQDNDRATILGLRSFGKGLIQEQFDYPDGSAARITIAHYYTPLGRSIQKPYAKGHNGEYDMELVRRYENLEYLHEDTAAQKRAEKFITPAGKILYGGGGIHPDVFVPLDTTAASPYFRKLYEKNLIFKYATKFTADHRDRLNSAKSIEELSTIFGQVNLYLDFVAWADRTSSVRPVGDELETTKKVIMAQLCAYIGRNTPLEDNALYYYFYPIDRTLLKAVNLF
ncbi:MAG: S41 family peptidase [Mucinivorans sp.]